MSAAVSEIHVYPVHDAPGRDLESVLVGASGLAGDRPKKAPVMVLSAEDTTDARANFVVGLAPDVLAGSVGSTLVVGGVALHVTGAAGSCPGVYAEVVRAGTVRVGDPVEIEAPGGA